MIRIVYILLLFQENLMTKAWKSGYFPKEQRVEKFCFYEPCIFATVTSYCWVSWSDFVIHSYSFLVYFHGTHLIYFTHYRSSQEKNFKVIHLNNLFIIDLFWYVTWRFNKRKYWWINLWSNWNNEVKNTEFQMSSPPATT